MVAGSVPLRLDWFSETGSRSAGSVPLCLGWFSTTMSWLVQYHYVLAGSVPLRVVVGSDLSSQCQKSGAVLCRVAGVASRFW